MTRQAKRPHQNMGSQYWQNLGLAAVVGFYLVLFGMDIHWQNTCGHMAIDYCSFRSAGQIANKYGYAKVYDLDVMGAVQKTTFPEAGDGSNFAVVPTPYLPVFIVPFQLFALIDPAAGFWLWTLLNLTMYVLYLRFFAQATTKAPMPTRLLMLLSLSLPVFLNFFYGQVNVWLTIGVGEFLRASISGRPWRAGLWLSLLLVKPQILILILPALVWQRAFKTIAGFGAALTALLGISFALMGTRGYASLLALWVAFARGLPVAIGPQVMMNWRMIGIFLNTFLPADIGWATIALGTAVTLLASAYVWRRRIDFGKPDFVIAVLGTLAATGLVSWHSHAYSSMMLLAPLVYLVQSKKGLPNGAILAWAFVPTIMYGAAILLNVVDQLAESAPNGNSVLNLLVGGGAFGLNVYFVAWAVRSLRKPGAGVAG